MHRSGRWPRSKSCTDHDKGYPERIVLGYNIPPMARAVTESALMAALSFLLYLAASIPVLGGFFILLCPVPLTLVGLRHGSRRAVLSCLCSVLLVAVLTGGPVQGYLYLVPFGLMGVITG